MLEALRHHLHRFSPRQRKRDAEALVWMRGYMERNAGMMAAMDDEGPSPRWEAYAQQAAKRLGKPPVVHINVGGPKGWSYYVPELAGYSRWEEWRFWRIVKRLARTDPNYR